MRMFVAVDLSDEIKASAFALRASARQVLRGAAFKFVDPQHLHLTLAFMADSAPDRVVPSFQQPIEMPPFEIAAGGLGVFPPRGAPRVLWIGLSSGATEVVALQKIVAGRLSAAGVALEDRAFHPHLTLGRWRQSRPSDRPSFAVDAADAGRMTVDHVTLYESRLSSEGPTHIALARTVLQ